MAIVCFTPCRPSCKPQCKNLYANVVVAKAKDGMEGWSCLGYQAYKEKTTNTEEQ